MYKVLSASPNHPNMLPRIKYLNWHFGALGSLITNPAIALLATLPLGIAGVILQSFELVLSAFNIFVGLMLLYLDRGIIEKWLISPLFWFASVLILTGGIGPVLIQLSDALEDVEKFSSGELIPMQIGILLGNLALAMGYLVSRPSFLDFPKFRENLTKQNLAVFKHSCFFLLLFTLIGRIVATVTGAADRGIYGDDAYYSVFGIWSFFGAFSRVGMIGFLLLPVAWLKSGTLGKSTILIIVLCILLLGFVEGSRSSFLQPLIFLVIGGYGTGALGGFRIKRSAIWLLPLAVASFIVIEYFRNTSTFQTTKMMDLGGRIAALSEISEVAERSNEGAIGALGSRLIGVIDPLIYAYTPGLVPHAGFENVHGLLWLPVPYFLYQNRPILLDGKIIAETYLGRELVRTSIGSSLTGDFYRRFGWFGMIPVLLFVGTLYGAYFRFFVFFSRSSNFLGAVILFSFTTVSVKDANMTLLSSFWLLLYEVPKTAFITYILFYVFSLFQRRGER